MAKEHSFIMEDGSKIDCSKAYQRRTKKCPYCGTECDADWCDVEVGLVQCGPYHCPNCNATEIGAYDKPRELSEVEKKTKWYAPFSPPGSSVNTFLGHPVDHKTAKLLYDLDLLDKK